MARVRNRVRAAAADERGFTFPELIIATVMALLISAAGMSLLVSAQRNEPEISGRAAQVQQGRAMIDGLIRELRQGESITAASASGFEILTHVNSQTCGGPPGPKATLCRVYYSCGSTTCTRTERNADGTGSAPSETVVRGITGPSLFTFAPDAIDPTYVGVNIVFPQDDGSESVTLRGGTSMRNYFQAAQ
jgi:hypothetical protein